jgi:hypothetical protein
MEINQLNELVAADILEAVNQAIPKFSSESKGRPLPSHIIKLIREKKKARLLMKKDPCHNNKSNYNYLVRQVKKAIVKFEDDKWANLLKDLGEYPVNTRLFWKKINQARNAKQSSSLPTLSINGRSFINDKQKADIFANNLKSTFTADCGESNDFDKKHFVHVNNFVDNLDFNNGVFVPFSSNELFKRISKLRINSASGTDSVQNLFIKKAPEEYLRNVILVLLNRAIKDKIPLTWKTADIIMIPKKQIKSQDPNDYRPISLTSCIGKLAERLVKTRLYKELENMKIIVDQQSGFREGRSTSDNLIFFTQKISESLERGRSAIGIFFDISKAFDKVWHNGLIYKLANIGISKYLIKYIHDFLNNRSFRVKVSNSLSEMFQISCSVPQGSVLGPILFLVYINDIPLTTERTSRFFSYSSLYADDLAVLYHFKNSIKIVEKNINLYIDLIGKWLFKWRLKINADKCCYTVFSNNKTTSNNNFNLNINGSSIPYDKNPVFLGVTFDRRLCFDTHIDNLKTRALKRFNIIKILCHKSWGLNKTTLVGVYNALVGSIFNYSFFCISRCFPSKFKSLQVIQNNAVRRIYRLTRDTSTSVLCSTSKIPLLFTRLIQLGCRYIYKSLFMGFPNSYIRLLVDEYTCSLSFIKNNPGSFNTPLCILLFFNKIAFLYSSTILLAGLGLALFSLGVTFVGKIFVDDGLD